MNVVVHWPRLGPYHLARLRAAKSRLDDRGIDLIALETAAQDEIYKWRRDTGNGNLRRITAFANASAETLRFRQLWPRFAAILHDVRPAAVVMNGYGAYDSLTLLTWCRLHRIPVVLMSDSKDDDAPRLWIKEMLKRGIVRQYSSALCAGERHRRYLMALGMDGRKIATGYDVVDNRYFSNGAARARKQPASYRHLPGLEETGPFFLASSRFLPRKNLDSLLLAYAAYRTRCRERGVAPWRLVILGDGPEQDRLHRLVREQKIAAITFPGFRQIEELPAYYGLATAFIHPALQDQWGLVVNEAMAAALPVLVSERAGCAPELVSSGRNGFAFDPTDLETMANLMYQFSTGQFDLEQMGRTSYRIIQDWGPERFAQGLESAVLWATGRR